MSAAMPRDKYRRVLNAIKEWGPLLAEEVAAEAGVDTKYANSALSYFRLHKKLVHITRWHRDKTKLHCRPLPVYAYGEGEDAPKPRPMSRREYNERHLSRRRVVSSVFDLGRALDTRRIAARLQRSSGTGSSQSEGPRSSAAGDQDRPSQGT
jgi:hypothetical protein